MSGRRGMVRFLVACFAAGVLVLSAPIAAGAAVITSLVSLADAARGVGWAPHPDQTGGGSTQFVDGPAAPPAGTGSLQMTVAANTDRALIFTVPRPGTGDTPPGEPGPILATPWGDLNGSSFSTFTANAASPASSIPALKFVGYQIFDPAHPLLATGFTTLNFEGSNQSAQGAVVANQWQTWTLGPNALVWQSNQTADPGFCPQANPCTLSAFAQHYTNGAWGQIQLGLGQGVPAGSTGNVDDVHVSAGAAGEFVYDFELTAPTTPSTPSTTVAGGAGGGATTSGTPLARTGSHTGESLAVALAFIAFGAALTVMAKRRRTAQ